jgi:hypothetical protein
MGVAVRHPMITYIVVTETENQYLQKWLASSWHTHTFTNKKCSSVKSGNDQNGTAELIFVAICLQ